VTHVMEKEGYEEGETLKSGLTWKSTLALFFVALTILPVNTYLTLISGATIAGAAVYIAVILFTEVSILVGAPMRKQEIYIIFVMASTATAYPALFLNSVYRCYYARSSIAWSFIDAFSGKPLPEVIPSWWTPTYSSPVFTLRTFLHPDWALPFILYLLQYGVLSIIMTIALTMICSIMYIEVEKLPFPMANVNAMMVSTLTERRVEGLKILTLTTIATIPYALIAYAVPAITGGLFGAPIEFIPIPWVDLTGGVYGMENFMPGALLGIATDPITFSLGFLLPLNLQVSMLIGSLATWTFGNWFTLTYLKNMFPEWASEWRSGMGISLIWQRSYLRVWAFPEVGMIAGLAIFSIASQYKVIARALGTLARSRGIRERGYLPLPILLAMYIGASLCSVLIFQMLVPDFPVWISILYSTGLSFLLGLVTTRVRGETGLTINVPYAWYTAMGLTNYNKIDAWLGFNPLIAGVGTTPIWVEGIKTAHLTETKPFDFFKAYFITFTIFECFGFIYASFFWALAPLPSSFYRWTLIQWPIQAINQSMWATRTILVKTDIIAYSIGGVIALGVVEQLLRKFAGMSFSIVGLVTGVTQLPPHAITLLLGGITAKFVLERLFGAEKWREHRRVVVAGIATGMSIVVGISAAIVIMAKSVWILPY